MIFLGIVWVSTKNVDCLRNLAFDVAILCLCTQFIGVGNSKNMYVRVIIR
jgi:hypothetical protein